MYSLMVLVALVRAATSIQPCCFPTPFQMVMLVSTASDDFGRGDVREMRADIAFDPQTNRSFTNETTYMNGSFINEIVITDYRQKVQYTIRNGTCNKDTPLNYPNYCVPDHFKPVDRWYIGPEAAPLYVTTYSRKSDRVVAEFVVTDDCIPTKVYARDSAGQTAFLTIGSYYNFTRGIRDPSIFNVPSICNKQRKIKPNKMYRKSTAK